MTFSLKRRSAVIGILILAAYSMLTYDITQNIPFGSIADIISGLSVIGISVLMYPLLNRGQLKIVNALYIFSRIVEGMFMIIGGILITSPRFVQYRAVIYESVHVYFFISGAGLFYYLLFQLDLVPKYISLWGIAATSALFLVTILKAFGIDTAVMNIFLAPIILNEFYLAFWLIFKGFTKDKSS